MPPYTVATGFQVLSNTLRPELANRICDAIGPIQQGVHLKYPADDDGPTIHYESWADVAVILQNYALVEALANDCDSWVRNHNPAHPEVIFAPNTPETKAAVKLLAEDLGAETAYLITLPSGRFTNELEEGSAPLEKRCVLIFNFASRTGGKCIGERLPAIARQRGGEVVATASFFLGTSAYNDALREKFPNNHYATFQLDIQHHKSSECPPDAPPLQNWNEI